MKYTYLDSPVGELLVVRDSVGICGLYLPTGKHPMSVRPEWTRDDTAFDDIRTQLEQYFAGERQDFELPLHAAGTDFQKRVWSALVDIPYGETTSYGRTAAAIDAPDAARAVGLANGQNPIAIVVPCHRVIGADGSLTGYGGGLDTKRWLLAHEATHSGATLPLGTTLPLAATLPS